MKLSTSYLHVFYSFSTLAFLLALAGCVTVDYLPLKAAGPVKADPSKIEVFAKQLPTRAYDEIGMMRGKGDADSTLSMIIDALKVEAAKYGADAIIIGQIGEHASGFFPVFGATVIETETTVQATAIRWKE